MAKKYNTYSSFIFLCRQHLDTEEVRRPFLCWSSKSCGELRLSLDLALDAKDELVDVTFAYNDDEFGGAVRGRGGRGEDWALLSGCNEESPL